MTPLVGLAARLSAGRPALLVVDMQNDFCAPEGYVAQVLGRDTSPCRAIVPAVAALIADARANGVPVVWLRAAYDDASVPAPMLGKKREAGITAVSCAEGSAGADWFGVAPDGGEAIFTKHCYSGFADPALDAHLRAHGITTLVIVGVQTNVCVESTLRDAHSLGYYVVVAEDGVASHMAAQHEATLANVRFLFGDVAPSAAIVEHWRRAAVPRGG